MPGELAEGGRVLDARDNVGKIYEERDKMKIDKVIEILTTFTFASNHISRNEVNDAIKISIEALKFRQRLEEAAKDFPYRPLPGETKD